MTSKAHSVKLKDRTLWFDGDSTVPEGEIVRLLSVGLPVDGLFVEQITDTIKQYNQYVDPEQRIGVKGDVADLRFDWNIPEEYKTLDVEEYVHEKLDDELFRKGRGKMALASTEFHRVIAELALYERLQLFNVLRVLIYIINTLHASNVIWSVGRGSSVSSYVLYLIGVHDVDSIEYGLDIEEFLRED